MNADAHLQVTKGNLCMELESDADANAVKEMNLSKGSVVYWYMGEEEKALCTITTEEQEYFYVIEKEEAGWKIRLEKAN